jgi:DNA-binding transcriptional LysR family regulator
MLDLTALVIFARVVEYNSFTKAARRLNIPTSTVSRRIADLESAIGFKLLERSTRSLRLTGVGAEILEQARAGAELSEAVDDIVTNHLSSVSGILRLSAPPSISDSLLTPLVNAFQQAHPNVRVQIFITDRLVNLIAEGVDLAFIVGRLSDETLVSRTILTYRHQLLASPTYLTNHARPETPEDLLDHRLLAFSFWTPENDWNFERRDRKEQKTLTFRPYLSMNDYAGLAAALVAGAGIGELPPLALPELLHDGRLVELMPKWRFRSFDLKLVHLGNRYIPRAVRAFKDLAAQMAPTLFPKLPN